MIVRPGSLVPMPGHAESIPVSRLRVVDNVTGEEVRLATCHDTETGATHVLQVKDGALVPDEDGDFLTEPHPNPCHLEVRG